jgi:hypothetical protein
MTCAFCSSIWVCASTISLLLTRISFELPESMTLPGLTSLWINRVPMVTQEIDRPRAAFVLGRIDEILS